MKRELRQDGTYHSVPEEKDWKLYRDTIRPAFEKQGEPVPWYLEPDAFEGWKN